MQVTRFVAVFTSEITTVRKNHPYRLNLVSAINPRLVGLHGHVEAYLFIIYSMADPGKENTTVHRFRSNSINGGISRRSVASHVVPVAQPKPNVVQQRRSLQHSGMVKSLSANNIKGSGDKSKLLIKLPRSKIITAQYASEEVISSVKFIIFCLIFCTSFSYLTISVIITGIKLEFR